MLDQQTDNFGYDAEHVRAFLQQMGVEADVLLDGNNQPLIVIATEDFDLRRGRIETWFTLIDQRGDYSYFHERQRGTGQTI